MQAIQEDANQIHWLAKRIRDGHQKLWDRLRFILSLPPEKRPVQLVVWDKANGHLGDLVKQLEATGQSKCLYRYETPPGPCLFCSIANGDWKQAECRSWSLVDEFVG